MEVATLWKWVRRVIRYYVYFIVVVWLTSALMLLYLMHAPASALPAPLAHPASSSTGPSSSGPYRLHSLMVASTATLHANMRSILNNTRATSDTLFRPPSPLHMVTSPIAEAVDAAISVLEGVVDGVCLVMRELADEWLVQTVEMMDELRERQNNPNTPSTRSLPWQQQQLDVGGDGRTGAAPAQQHKQHNRQHTAEGGKQAAGESTAATTTHRHATPPRSPRQSDGPSRPSLTITAPIQSTHRSVLPDGSVLFLSPLASDDAAFSMESVAEMGEGVEGEQRVALSLKDGLIRMTRKGQREDRDGRVSQLRAEHKAGNAATAA